MKYYLKFWSKVAQANVSTGVLATLIEAEEHARKSLSETDRIEIIQIPTNRIIKVITQQ